MPNSYFELKLSLKLIMLHFIIGTGRCGTNLLNKMLGYHPQIMAVTETHFISTLATRFADVELSPQEFWAVLDEHYTSNGQHRWIDAHLKSGGIVDKDAFQQQFIETSHTHTTHATRILLFFRMCYEKTAAAKCRFFVDKTPQYGLHIQAISRLFPQSKFIHLIRDGRFAATSMMKHKGISRLIKGEHPDALANFSYEAQLSQFEPYQATVGEAILYWEKIVKATQAQAATLSDSQYLELYYEDLIARPRHTLRQVCDFLELPFDGMWKYKAILLPDPQAPTREHTRLAPDEYATLTNLVKNTLEAHHYFTGNFNEFRNKKTTQSIDNVYFRKTFRRVFKIE